MKKGNFADGQVGINIKSPGSYTLYVNGAAYATGEFTNTKEAQQ
jgi:hypothetical protein